MLHLRLRKCVLILGMPILRHYFRNGQNVCYFADVGEWKIGNMTSLGQITRCEEYVLLSNLIEIVPYPSIMVFHVLSARLTCVMLWFCQGQKL